MKIQEFKKPTPYLYESVLHTNELSLLSVSQRRIIEQVQDTLLPFINEYQSSILLEAPIAVDQITQVFGQAAELHKGTPAGKGILQKTGKAIAQSLPVEVARKANDALNGLSDKLESNEAVQGFNAQVDKQILSVKTLLAKNPISNEVLLAIQGWKKQGIENPTRQALIIGAIVLVASFAGGPLGGAIAGFIVKTVSGMIQGQTLTKAGFQAMKVAAYGAIAGWALQGLGDWFEGLRTEVIPYDKAPGLETLSMDFEYSLKMPGFESTKTLHNLVVPEVDVEQFRVIADTITQNAGNSDEAIGAFNQLWNHAKTFDTDAFLADMNLANDVAQEIAIANDAFLQNLTAINSGIAALAQGSVTAASDDGSETEIMPSDVEVNGQPVKAEEPTAERINEDSDLYELDFSGIKRVAGTLGNKVKGALADAGDKLQDVGTWSEKGLIKQWKAAGSPEDTDAIRNILVSAGMSADTIDTAFSNAKITINPTDTKELSSPDADASDEGDNEQSSDTDVKDTGDTEVAEPSLKDRIKTDVQKSQDAADQPAATTIPADISDADLIQMLIDAGLVNLGSPDDDYAGYDPDFIGFSKDGDQRGNPGIPGSIKNQALAKLIASKDYEKENEMRVDEMCGGGCGTEMEMPKTNYNLSVTKDEGNTHKSMTVTSDQPDELIRVLQLSGMDTGHSEPDGDEIAGVDMDHDEPMDQHSQMKGLIAKIANPHNGDDEHDHDGMTHSHPGGDEDHEHDDEAHEEAAEVEQDIRSKPSTFSVRDLVPGQVKKQPRQRKVAAKHGDNPYKDAGQLEEKYVRAYAEFKED